MYFLLQVNVATKTIWQKRSGLYSKFRIRQMRNRFTTRNQWFL